MGTSFVPCQGTDEKLGFRVKKNCIVEVDMLLETSAVALEIVNYGVSVTLAGDVLDGCNLYNLLCRQLNQHLSERFNRAKDLLILGLDKACKVKRERLP